MASVKEMFKSKGLYSVLVKCSSTRPPQLSSRSDVKENVTGEINGGSTYTMNEEYVDASNLLLETCCRILDACDTM